MAKILILCANGLEECEALIANDLFRRAKLESYLISIHQDLMITSSNKVNFKCDLLLNQINPEDYDALYLPGGLMGVNNLKNSSACLSLIKEFHAKKKLIAAICAAPSIIADDLKLVKDNEFTCYPGCSLSASNNQRFFKKDHLLTAKGLGVAFEFAKEIIAYLENKELGERILKQIQYEQ